MIYSRHKTIGLFVASEGCFKAWQNSKTSIDVTSETVMENRRDALMIIILIAAPPLLASLAVGLITSIFQAVTQIQEFTLTFIPKILADAAGFPLDIPPIFLY